MSSKEPRIIITTGDEPPEPNTTLLALLRDGEKFKPGDPRGTLADRLGAVVQRFLADQKRAADYRRTAVKGKIVFTLNFVTGPDGSQTYTCEEKITAAKIPARTSMTFTDDDGEVTGRPVEPLTEEMYRREKAADKTSAEPKVGAASKL
jgi:hypothetical protein